MSSSLIRRIARRVIFCWLICFAGLVAYFFASLAASPRLGMSPREVAEALAFSSLWYALVAAVVGIPGGLLLAAVAPASGRESARGIKGSTDD